MYSPKLRRIQKTGTEFRFPRADEDKPEPSSGSRETPKTYRNRVPVPGSCQKQTGTEFRFPGTAESKTGTEFRFLTYNKTISKGVVLLILLSSKIGYTAGVATCSIIRSSTVDLYLYSYSKTVLR